MEPEFGNVVTLGQAKSLRPSAVPTYCFGLSSSTVAPMSMYFCRSFQS